MSRTTHPTQGITLTGPSPPTPGSNHHVCCIRDCSCDCSLNICNLRCQPRPNLGKVQGHASASDCAPSPPQPVLLLLPCHGLPVPFLMGHMIQPGAQSGGSGQVAAAAVPTHAPVPGLLISAAHPFPLPPGIRKATQRAHVCISVRKNRAQTCQYTHHAASLRWDTQCPDSAARTGCIIR